MDRKWSGAAESRRRVWTKHRCGVRLGGMSERSRNDIEVSRNENQHRYELRVGGIVAGTADYEEESGSVALTHTAVREQFQHQGYSSILVQHAAEEIIASGRRIKPYCSYAASYLGKHPELSHHVSWPQESR